MHSRQIDMIDTHWIGTRGSALALAQAGEIRERLTKAHPRLRFDLRIIKTTGDKLKTTSLPKSGTKGLFTRELETALLRAKIVVAAHSLKDLPTEVPAGLRIAAVTEREDPRDVLIFKKPDWTPDQGGTAATSSPRRHHQLRHRWPGLKVVEIRGNVETRLQKLLDRGEWDAIVLAGAGLKRLGYLKPGEADRLSFGPLYYRWLEFEEMLPAPGQAAVGLEICDDNERSASLVQPINHFRSQAETAAERSFLKAMGGGCLQPLAALGRARADQLTLRGLVFSADGGRRWEGEISGSLGHHEELGKKLADRLKSQGAKF